MSELDPKGVEAAARALAAYGMPIPHTPEMRASHIDATWRRYREEADRAITAYLSTVSPLSDGDGWQPIETCPKDGRSVMVWIASTAMARAHCLAPVSICDDGSWWDDETGDQIEPIASAYLWAPIHPPKSPAPPHDEVA